MRCAGNAVRLLFHFAANFRRRSSARARAGLSHRLLTGTMVAMSHVVGGGAIASPPPLSSGSQSRRSKALQYRAENCCIWYLAGSARFHTLTGHAIVDKMAEKRGLRFTTRRCQYDERTVPTF